MRKMTYTQAATCGENLKVRVTPEQSEKMQRAWFKAGKEWVDGTTKMCATTECFLYLHDGGKLTVGVVISEFERHVNTEIELVDDLPQHDFASQQEIWKWLVQGNKVVLKDFGDIYGFNCVGKLNNFSSPYKSTDISFSVVENWKKYTPPHIIRVNGVEVPAPVDSLDGLDFVYIPNLLVPRDPIQVRASFAITNCYSLDLCYATKEDAIKRAEAMLKFEVVE